MSSQLSYDFNPPKKILPFEYGKDIKSHAIILQTKKLVGNTQNYNQYIQNFYNHTRLITYKLPLIQTQNNFNSGKLSSNSFPSETNTCIKNRYSMDSDNINNSFLTPVKSLEGEKLKNLKNPTSHGKKLNFKSQSKFEFSEFSKRYYNEDGQSDKEYNHSNNMFLTDVVSKFTNLDLSPHTISNSTLKLSSLNRKKVSGIQQLSEIFFNFSSLELIYDDREIFSKKDYFRNYIKRNLFYGEINKNRTEILKTFFNPGRTKEISLILHSIEITFKNMENNSQIKNFTFTLPFELIHPFYVFDLEKFKYVLLSSLRFSQNFDNVKINEEEFFIYVKDLLDKQSESHNKVEDYFKKGLEKIFKFVWITSKTKFEVEIKLPYIEMNISKSSKTIFKFVDTELLYFLFNINFSNWEFYCVNYLISLTEFRNYFTKIFSKADSIHIKQRSMRFLGESKSITRTKIKIKKPSDLDNEKNLNIEESSVKSITNANKEENEINEEKENQKGNQDIFKNENKIKNYSDKDLTLSFLVTIFNSINHTEIKSRESEDIQYPAIYASYIYKLTSFSVEISNSLGKRSTINFNIKQMRLLSYISKFVKIESLIKKLVLNDNQNNPYIDLSFFDKVENKNFALLEQLFNAAIPIKKITTHYEENNHDKDDLHSIKIKINWPKVSRTTLHAPLKKKYSDESNEEKSEEMPIFDEIILDKTSLGKICVKDIYLMIELIEKEISFQKIDNIAKNKSKIFGFPQLLKVNKLLKMKVKTPKLK